MKGKYNRVGVLIGSESDREIMSETCKILDKFKVSYEIVVASAHRNPKKVREYAESAEKRGIGVIIAGAGMAAHLPGVVASYTLLPVIGVPLPGSHFSGIDSLFSVVQMPGGIPVACMSVGKAGAKNAGILACQILSLENKALWTRLKRYRKELRKN